MISDVKVYGYKESFAVNPDVQIFFNGEEIGKVSRNGEYSFQPSTKGLLVFKSSLRKTSLKIDENKSYTIQLYWNRIWGTLNTKVIENQKQNEASESKSMDSNNLSIINNFNIERFYQDKKIFRILAIIGAVFLIFSGIVLLANSPNSDTDNRGSSLNQGSYSLSGSVKSATLNNGDYAGHQYTGTLRNNLSVPQNFTIDIRIYSSNGNLLASDTNRYRLEPGQSTTVLFFFSGIGNLYGSYDIRVLAFE